MVGMGTPLGKGAPANAPGVVVICTSCGAAGYDGDRYCACCGNPTLRSCGSCGGSIRHPIAYYCTDCGAPLSTMKHFLK